MSKPYYFIKHKWVALIVVIKKEVIVIFLKVGNIITGIFIFFIIFYLNFQNIISKFELVKKAFLFYTNLLLKYLVKKCIVNFEDSCDIREHVYILKN